MKKIASLSFVSLLSVGILLGCQSDQSVQETKNQSQDGPVEVEFWYAGGKTAVKVVQDIIDEYNASQDDFEIKAVTQADYSETYTRLQAGIAGNQAPDFALLGANDARNLNENDLAEDLNAQMTSDNVKADNYLEVFAEQGVSEDGERFGLPAYGTTQVLYYNISAFKEANIDPESIKTWQDLGEAAKAIKDTGKFMYGWEPMWGSSNLIDASLSNGAQLISEDGRTVQINSKEWVEVWESFRKWIHDDQIMTVHSGGQGWEYWYKTIDDVLDNTAGGYIGSSGDQADLDFSIVQAMEQPAWSDKTSSAPVANALLLTVMKNSSEEEKEGAFEFIKYFTSVQSQIKWTKEVGYVAVNKNILEDKDYKAYVAENPQALVPFSQVKHGSILPLDPTGGAIYDALTIAADKVELENVPAEKALDEAQKVAQEALDKALKK
ncbi:ABC transporter substrate-binding protein [Streptococcus merionis]|uniref:ABC transporter substrate-binding protein n=1 Tax=Streptococcus merionis TaxID=400065 RepID=UPI0026EDCB67|nr:ABC transporter substrate-binding protein [Streptococcus merionis]